MKALRYLLIAIVAIIVMAVVAIAIAMALIDPNDYKPQIEKAVEQQTNLDLNLRGDIGWSFIPLGLELNQVDASLDDEPFLALERLVAEVNFWSLITMAPQVDRFLLDGLDTRLVVDEQGKGNWTRIMKDSPEEPQAPAATEQPSEAEPEAAEGGEPLNFNVDSVQISNAQVHYTDLATGQAVTLDDFSVTASAITLGSEFPLEVGFRVETAQPKLTVDGTIKARLAANEALNEFAVSGLTATFDLTGGPFGGQSVTATLAGSAQANLERETATLSDFTARLADLALSADLSVEGFGENTALNGSLAVAEFSLKDLLASLGQPAIETRDPEVLNALAFNTQLGGSPGKIALSDLTLQLDDTTFKGSGSYTLSNGAVVFALNGDQLNADRYLPPATEGEAEAAPQQSAQTASPGPEGELLPLDTLRALLLDIDFGLGELVVSNLTINDIKASTTANKGVLKVDEFSGKLYFGTFNANATIDARTDTPTWAFGSKVANVQTLPLLTDLADVTMLSGAANLNVDVSSRGNRVSVLRENAQGEINFNLAEGEFRNMNLTRLACQGIALANREQLSTTDWGATTPFNDMHGTLKIDGNTLRNPDLVAALAGMRLEGTGTVDLQKTALDYEAGLRIVGEIHRDQACRVTEYVENAVIPVECRGNFADDPAGLCSFDGSRFRDTLAKMAENAAKAKAEEELDRAREKAEEKVKEKLGEELGDKLKGLFN